RARARHRGVGGRRAVARRARHRSGAVCDGRRPARRRRGCRAPARLQGHARRRRRADVTMPVPILKQDNTLIASVVAALSDQELIEFRDQLAERIGVVRARGVIIDVTALDVLDSFATRTLRGIAYTAKLRGAETVIVGIQPEVAFTMVQLGLSLEGVATALDLEEGLAFLDRGAKKIGRDVGATG